MVKNLPTNAGDARDVSSVPGSGRSPGIGIGSPLQQSCLEHPRGQRSLAGYSPWGCKELDTTEQRSIAHMKMKQEAAGRGPCRSNLGQFEH